MFSHQRDHHNSDCRGTISTFKMTASVAVAVVALCLIPITHGHVCSPPSSLIPNEPRQACTTACATIPGHLVLNGTWYISASVMFCFENHCVDSTEVCCAALDVLSKPCVKSLISWAGPENITANQVRKQIFSQTARDSQIYECTR